MYNKKDLSLVMRKVVQKTKYGTFFLWNMSDGLLFVDDFLQIPGKCLILFPRAFGRPFRGLAGTEAFLIFVTAGRQNIDIPGCVLQPVPVDHPGPPGRAHAGKDSWVMPISPGVTRLTRAESTLSAPLSKTSVSAPSRLMRWAVSHRIFTGTPCTRTICIVRSTTGQLSASPSLVTQL